MFMKNCKKIQPDQFYFTCKMHLHTIVRVGVCGLKTGNIYIQGTDRIKSSSKIIVEPSPAIKYSPSTSEQVLIGTLRCVIKEQIENPQGTGNA